MNLFVESCNLVLDKATGKSKGFGFVEMPKHIEAKLAIKRFEMQNPIFEWCDSGLKGAAK